MAELQVKDNGGGKKIRSKKISAFVDLTAMVDLAFLLITFFMLTTTLAKAQSMNLAMPDKPDKPEEKVDDIKISEYRTVTLLLGTDDKVAWYYGQELKPFEGPTVTTYGKDGIRKVLLQKTQQVLAHTGKEEEGLIVVIKPSDKSLYHNLVDALDEMAITGTPSYAIMDITPYELSILEELGIN